MKPPKLILALTASLGLLVPAIAEDRDDEGDHVHHRTKAEVHDFLKKHLPETLRHLRHAEEEDHHEAVEEFWQHTSEFVGEFYHMREELGEEAAETLLQLHRLQFVADGLTARFHDIDDESEAGKIKEELRKVIGAHLELSLKLEHFHLAQARKELEEAVRELEETAAHHEEIINEELAQRLHGDEEEEEGPGEGDDDGDEDEEDDGDEDEEDEEDDEDDEDEEDDGDEDEDEDEDEDDPDDDER